MFNLLNLHLSIMLRLLSENMNFNFVTSFDEVGLS